jgi:hypothetical protein
VPLSQKAVEMFSSKPAAAYCADVNTFSWYLSCPAVAVHDAIGIWVPVMVPEGSENTSDGTSA